jgi:hypothetical protein
MRRRARTDLCGGRSAMVVPTASASQSGSKSLSPLVNGKAYLIAAFWRKLVRLGPSPLVTHRADIQLGEH